MSHKDLDNLLGSFKKVFDPEAGIPKDEEANPLNYRIVRTRALLKELMAKQKDLLLEMEKVETNILEILQEINKSEPVVEEATKKEQDKD